jgi:hypothetical protein
LPIDCVTSTRAIDTTAALTRMGQAGAVISTIETLAFELMEHDKHENFDKVIELLGST